MDCGCINCLVEILTIDSEFTYFIFLEIDVLNLGLGYELISGGLVLNFDHNANSFRVME